MDGGDNIVDTFWQNLNFAREALFSQQTLALVNQHVLSPSSPLHTLRRQFLDLLSTLYNDIMSPVLQPVLDRAMQAFMNSPDVVVLAVVVVLLLVAVQVLLWVRRVVAWFTALVLRLVFWSFVAGLAAVVWQRGLDQAVRDLVAFVGAVMGYAELIYRYTSEVWLREYERYEAQQNLVKNRAG
ncbi:hypothetical protein N8I77_003926 [Diaporthe amygdali]|uniref:Uncharacterized protein n=1 Tax=Phomopsis amygdali TaxID=1214568 RepID=A0AAD9SIX1_PHOAM|nr:uncharacterized protein J7T55_007076 [Diaporthe amygdali]KAJ0107864.1 hypothetical protein J7T55_007076 [Diaporthe amygdali]KAK2610500.1 hypothetical protein N8I77_003926 [Diaporthe amygdali]